MESVFMISLPVGHRLKWDVRVMVKTFYPISSATPHFRTKLDVVRYSSICVLSYRRWVSAPPRKVKQKTIARPPALFAAFLSSLRYTSVTTFPLTDL